MFGAPVRKPADAQRHERQDSGLEVPLIEQGLCHYCSGHEAPTTHSYGPNTVRTRDHSVGLMEVKSVPMRGPRGVYELVARSSSLLSVLPASMASSMVTLDAPKYTARMFWQGQRSVPTHGVDTSSYTSEAMDVAVPVPILSVWCSYGVSDRGTSIAAMVTTQCR